MARVAEGTNVVLTATREVLALAKEQGLLLQPIGWSDFDDPGGRMRDHLTRFRDVLRAALERGGDAEVQRIATQGVIVLLAWEEERIATARRHLAGAGPKPALAREGDPVGLAERIAFNDRPDETVRAPDDLAEAFVHACWADGSGAGDEEDALCRSVLAAMDGARRRARRAPRRARRHGSEATASTAPNATGAGWSGHTVHGH